MQNYLLKINNDAISTVFGSLLDLKADINYINELLNNIGAKCKIN